jgi:predicted xylose isomerase-like sugar epimerase
MNDNPDKEDVKRAVKDARVRMGRAKMKGDSGDEEFNARKLNALKSFKQYVKEDWKRAALMGAAATAAGAGTAAAIGFPVVAGAVLAGGQYALSSKGLRKDLKRKRFN